MDAHRDWLLSTYGPHCAYCGQTIKPETATLDHVRPRKGQKAYDRPDNLVIACRDCNAAKADMPLVSWLLQRKSRAVLLLEYGHHLSSGLQQEAARLVDRPMLDLSSNDGTPVAVGLRFRPGRPGKRR
ncbi:MAG: HNH endonuclease [Gemmatimonadales bacterium]